MKTNELLILAAGKTLHRMMRTSKFKEAKPSACGGIIFYTSDGKPDVMTESQVDALLIDLIRRYEDIQNEK